MSTFAEAARTTEIFSTLSAAQLESLSQVSRRLTLRDGQVLFSEGDAPDGLYVIESGTVRIAKGRGALPGTYARFVATLGQGDTVGEMALVLDSARTATVVANSEVVVHALPREAFDALLERQDPVAHQVLRNLAALACRRLEKTCDGLVDLSQRATTASAISTGLEAVQSIAFQRQGR